VRPLRTQGAQNIRTRGSLPQQRSHIRTWLSIVHHRFSACKSGGVHIRIYDGICSYACWSMREPLDSVGGSIYVPIPTVCLDVMALVASSCGYTRGEIEQRVAHEFMAHVATERARGTCTTPPAAARSARRSPCGRVTAGVHGSPRAVAPLRHHAASRDTSGAAHGKRNALSASHAS